MCRVTNTCKEQRNLNVFIKLARENIELVYTYNLKSRYDLAKYTVKLVIVTKETTI